MNEDIEQIERRRITAIMKHAVTEEGLWSVALFFLIWRRRLVRIAVSARVTPPSQTRSPFVYQLR